MASLIKRHGAAEMEEMYSAPGVVIRWLDQPVTLHSSRETSCDMTPDQCAYKQYLWRNWYKADLVYGRAVVYFVCATVGVFAILYLLARYGPDMRGNRLVQRIRAAGRYVAYKSAPWWLGGSLSYGLGVPLLIGVGIIFFFAITLGPKPYYWDNIDFGHSPPIATRAGWLALGLLPFVLALASKANLISALTGVPYEKLQIFHQWTSYAMFVLALIHTFPFIVVNIREGIMEVEWRMSVFWWTGVAALVCQGYLTIMSYPWIRNRFYEFFKFTHIFVSVMFILFLFFHCDFRLTAWDYFIVAGSLYFASLFYSWGKTYLFNGLHTAHISLLPCGYLSVRIPSTMSWTPGQHVFLRFLTLDAHMITAHPFTISSAAHQTEICGHPNEMTFYIKPRTGITRHLARLALRKQEQSMAVRVLVEGPYGGVDSASLAKTDHILVIAGGSGAGFSLGVIEDTARRFARISADTSNEQSRSPCIQAVYATRTKETADWYAEHIREHQGTYNKCNLDVSIYVTSPSSSKPDIADDDVDAKQPLPATSSTAPDTSSPSSESPSIVHVNPATATPFSSPRTFVSGRPNLREIIASTRAATANSSSLGVIVCGPTSMINDVRDAVAEEQLKVLSSSSSSSTDGEKEKTRVVDVWLHAEHFSW